MKISSSSNIQVNKPTPSTKPTPDKDITELKAPSEQASASAMATKPVSTEAPTVDEVNSLAKFRDIFSKIGEATQSKLSPAGDAIIVGGLGTAAAPNSTPSTQTPPVKDDPQAATDSTSVSGENRGAVAPNSRTVRLDANLDRNVQRNFEASGNPGRPAQTDEERAARGAGATDLRQIFDDGEINNLSDRTLDRALSLYVGRPRINEQFEDVDLSGPSPTPNDPEAFAAYETRLSDSLNTALESGGGGLGDRSGDDSLRVRADFRQAVKSGAFGRLDSELQTRYLDAVGLTRGEARSEEPNFFPEPVNSGNAFRSGTEISTANTEFRNTDGSAEAADGIRGPLREAFDSGNIFGLDQRTRDMAIDNVLSTGRTFPGQRGFESPRTPEEIAQFSLDTINASVTFINDLDPSTSREEQLTRLGGRLRDAIDFGYFYELNPQTQESLLNVLGIKK